MVHVYYLFRYTYICFLIPLVIYSNFLALNMVSVCVTSILSAVQLALLNPLMRVLLRYGNVYSKCVNSWSPHHPHLTSLTAPLSQWIANSILYLLGPRALESSSLPLITNFQLVKKLIIFGLPSDYTWNPITFHHSGCYDLDYTTIMSCLDDCSSQSSILRLLLWSVLIKASRMIDCFKAFNQIKFYFSAQKCAVTSVSLRVKARNSLQSSFNGLQGPPWPGPC